ncbi:MAG: cytochrome C oxidase Cbb3 [Flavobacterium sp.]|nr:MAG: cytochrome C oxidase Cbb3 [Flavobacterium sp.]
MKLNWGTSIVIAFVLFMSFILYFVIKVQGNSKYDNELVIDEYYKHDAHFGEEMTKLQNAEELTEKPQISAGSDGVTIDFPLSMQSDKIQGTVSFYRPSSKKLDFVKAIALTDHSMIISSKDFPAGEWRITLSWKYDGKDFTIEKGIYTK